MMTPASNQTLLPISLENKTLICEHFLLQNRNGINKEEQERRHKETNWFNIEAIKRRTKEAKIQHSHRTDTSFRNPLARTLEQVEDQKLLWILLQANQIPIQMKCASNFFRWTQYYYQKTFMLAAITAALKESDHSLIVQCDSAEVYNSDFNQGKSHYISTDYDLRKFEAIQK